MKLRGQKETASEGLKESRGMQLEAEEKKAIVM